MAGLAKQSVFRRIVRRFGSASRTVGVERHQLSDLIEQVMDHMTSNPNGCPASGPQPDLTRCLCLAADIERYSRFDTPDQRAVQAELARVMRAAAELSGLDHAKWVTQPQGDQEFAVLPGGTPEPVVLSDFVSHLAAELGGYNAIRPEARRMRLRLAIDTGVAATAALGFSGPAPIAVARYLSAPEVAQALAKTRSASLVVVISDRLYQDVVKSRLNGLDPQQYRRIHVERKGFGGYGWVQLPGTVPHDLPRARRGGSGGEPQSSREGSDLPGSGFVQRDVNGTAIQGVINGSVICGAPSGGADR
ncbi:hypothetical protein ACFYNO_06930 [Kitasatospora sp. NPDC006697]|uniref:hypothetical protein n=1 Tax=Kitasatospora sp. NPDC006697 TaxID=3364020 RepID=UPI0036A39B54